MLLITDAAIGITIRALLFRKQTPELAPDYAPQEAEEYARTGGKNQIVVNQFRIYDIYFVDDSWPEV